jgi:hypothetical protein
MTNPTDEQTATIKLTKDEAKALRSVLRLASADANDNLHGASASAYIRNKQTIALARNVIGQINNPTA